MKITFSDGSYIEVVNSSNPDKILITITAKHPDDDLSLIANSVEISGEELKKLVDEVLK